MRRTKVVESKRSEEVRSELRKQGYRIYWDVLDHCTRISYATNGLGKVLLLLEHAHNMDGVMTWQSWDLYRPLTMCNSVADTFSALQLYTEAVI